jgi:endonuclease III
MKPADLPAVYRILKREFERNRAPIVDLVARSDTPFHVLVATILSTRTKDDCTAAVCGRLFKAVRTPSDFSRLTVAQIERLIFPIGFYRTKARHLKRLPEVLAARFGGRIPDTREGLMELPGVGRKVANLVLAQGFGQPAICVDVHVHRIGNRLGLIRTRRPFETELALARLLPRRYWRTWNSYLVSFGQRICAPVSPKCSVCPLARYCDRVGVSAHR